MITDLNGQYFLCQKHDPPPKKIKAMKDSLSFHKKIIVNVTVNHYKEIVHHVNKCE